MSALYKKFKSVLMGSAVAGTLLFGGGHSLAGNPSDSLGNQEEQMAAHGHRGHGGHGGHGGHHSHGRFGYGGGFGHHGHHHNWNRGFSDRNFGWGGLGYWGGSYGYPYYNNVYYDSWPYDNEYYYNTLPTTRKYYYDTYPKKYYDSYPSLYYYYDTQPSNDYDYYYYIVPVSN